jgi:Ca-activated chloride channel homolog
VLGFVAAAGMIVALARPQVVEEKRQTNVEGYDILLALDLSGSMLFVDDPQDRRMVNRLQTLKPVLKAFIEQRAADRIGIVVFATEALTLAPLTFDHDWLRRQTERLEVGLLKDGTAIGDGLALAVSRLQQAERMEGGKRKGAFVILLTDGVNNAGRIAPLAAAAAAAERGLPVFTIAAGKEGHVLAPVYDEQGRMQGYQPQRSHLDLPTLKAMAERTGGQFFRAEDAGTIQRAFTAINEAKKIEFESTSYSLVEEKFSRVAGPAALALLLALPWGGWRRRARP